MSTTERDPLTRPPALRSFLLLGVPLVLLALLRLLPPLPLDASPLIAWAAPTAAAIVALGAAVAMLVALVEGLHSGSAASFLNAAGKGVLAATYAVEAFAGPVSSSSVPSAASAVGGALAGVLFVTGAVLGLRRIRVVGPRAQAVGVIAIFALTELALGIVSVGLASGYRQPEETSLRFLAAGLLALTAALVVTHARHVLSPAFLAVGTLVLALARVGSADVLVALAALLAGMVVFVDVHLRLLREARVASTHGAAAGLGALEELGRSDRLDREAELGQVQRLTRELRGTIDELAQARRTVELQRAELERAARVDALTGAASRRSILERLRAEAAEARRYQHPLALLLLDVDRLGSINAEHGLAAGDAVLREVALRMRLRIRESDALGRADGGGFLSILPHTDERGAAVFADTLRRRIAARPFLVSSESVEVRVSIGVAIMRPGMDLSEDDLLANADEALRSARAAGGDRIAFDRAHGLARIEERRRPSDEAGDSGDSGGSGDSRAG